MVDHTINQTVVDSRLGIWECSLLTSILCPPEGRWCCWRGTSRTGAPPRRWPLPPRWRSTSACPPAGRWWCWRGTARTGAPLWRWPLPPRWQVCREVGLAGPQASAFPPTSLPSFFQTSDLCGSWGTFWPGPTPFRGKNHNAIASCNFPSCAMKVISYGKKVKSWVCLYYLCMLPQVATYVACSTQHWQSSFFSSSVEKGTQKILNSKRPREFQQCGSIHILKTFLFQLCIVLLKSCSTPHWSCFSDLIFSHFLKFLEILILQIPFKPWFPVYIFR